MSEGFSKVREVLVRHVDSVKIPGVVALVSRGDETYVETLGTMRHDGAAPSTTRCRPGDRSPCGTS